MKNTLKNIFGKVIIEGVATHKELLVEAIAQKLPLKGLDACGLNLSGLEFEGVDFTLSKFDKAYLKGSTFRNCKMNDTNWLKANVVDSCFVKCDVSNAYFKNANVSTAKFEHCNLYQSSFEGSDVTNSKWQDNSCDFMDLSSCFLDGINMESQKMNHVSFSYPSSATGVKFREAKFYKCGFVGLVGTNIDFERSKLSECLTNYMELNEGSNIKQTLVQECTGRDMKLKGVKGSRAQFIGGDYKGIQIYNSVLIDATLEGDFSTNYVEGSDLSNLSGLSSNFSSGKFLDVSLRNSNLGLANIANTTFQNCDTKGANFSLVKKNEKTEFINSGQSVQPVQSKVVQHQTEALESFIVKPHSTMDLPAGFGKTISAL